MALTAEQMKALSEPFPLDAIQWKPGATNHDKTRALALPYVDLRHYIDRLNEVAGADWSDDYEIQGSGQVVVCRLTIGGVTRADVGEAPPNDENTATIALAQAFKRACVKFGLGAHLYRMPSQWVPYDAQRKRISEEGLRQLAGAPVRQTQAAPVRSGGGNGRAANGDVGPTEFWNAAFERGIEKTAAKQIARGSGTWAQKLEALG